jgi:hypothetical protein
MIDLVPYLAELAVWHKSIAVYPDCLESFALRAKCHYLSGPDLWIPGIVPWLMVSNTTYTLPQHTHAKILYGKLLKSYKISGGKSYKSMTF